MSKTIKQTTKRCRRTGTHITYKEVTDGDELVALHITMESLSAVPEWQIVDNYEVENLPQNFNWRGYE